MLGVCFGCSGSTDDGTASQDGHLETPPTGGAPSGSTTPSQSATPPQIPTFPASTPYAKARETLLAQGWAPFHVDAADTCFAGDDRCQGRPEMAFCSGTGEAQCGFLWKKGDTLIEVITGGETDPVVDKVTSDTSNLPSLTGTTIPTFPASTPYAKARETFQSDGWAPFHVDNADTCSEGDDRCQGRPEMAFCSGTGEALCGFLWKKGGTLVEVITGGETDPFVDSVGVDTSNLPSVTGTTIPTFPASTPYADARKALINAGWAPFHLTNGDTCSEGDDRCQGRPEMAFCSGTGEALCGFLWKKGGTLIEVITGGETDPFVDSVGVDTSNLPDLKGAIVAP
jgi:hypothetical protein